MVPLATLIVIGCPFDLNNKIASVLRVKLPMSFAVRLVAIAGLLYSGQPNAAWTIQVQHFLLEMDWVRKTATGWSAVLVMLTGFVSNKSRRTTFVAAHVGTADQMQCRRNLPFSRHSRLQGLLQRL
jgi:hypothetical protein